MEKFPRRYEPILDYISKVDGKINLGHKGLIDVKDGTGSKTCEKYNVYLTLLAWFNAVQVPSSGDAFQILNCLSNIPFVAEIASNGDVIVTGIVGIICARNIVR